MKKHLPCRLVFALCALAAALLLLLPGCLRQVRFDRAEREFRAAANLQSDVLAEVLSAYVGAAPDRIASLHGGFLRDGTFDLLDSLDGVLSRSVERMQRSCPRRAIPRLVEGMELRNRLTRRLNDAELPFVYRDYPPPWESMEPDARQFLESCGFFRK